MNKTLSILFYLKKAKEDRNGLVPIYLRITVDGQRAEMSIHRSIKPDNWNTKAGLAKGTKEEYKNLNESISNYKNKVYQHYNRLLTDYSAITAEVLKNKVLDIDDKKQTLVELFEYHNKQVKEKVGIDYVEGTSKRFEVSLRKVKAFLVYKYHRSDIELSELNYQFITEYEFYLKTQSKCQQNTVLKYIKNLKKIVNIALANDWLDKNPFLTYKCIAKETNRQFLTQEEIDVLANKVFQINRLEIIRDIFLFSCYTGLAYIDVYKLTPQDITIGIDGEKWIIVNRTKTDTRSSIPLLPKAMEIVEKYKNYPENNREGKLLPLKSNQKMNAYLKEIADLCEITKPLTYHIARHTFATTITLTNNVPIETVSKMLGHRSIRTTQIYSKVVDAKISEDMKLLRDRLSIVTLNKVTSR